MVVSWIAITLVVASLAAIIYAHTSGEFETAESFVIAFIVTCQLSLIVAVVYVAAHFIGKYW